MWYRRAPAVATGSLLLGLVLGVAVGLALGGGDGTEEGAMDWAAGQAETGEGRTSTTEIGVPPSMTAVTLAPACLETIRSAEEASQLLNEGLRSLRRLDVNDVEKVLDQMREESDDLRLRVEDCLEDQGIGPGPRSVTTPGGGE